MPCFTIYYCYYFKQDLTVYTLCILSGGKNMRNYFPYKTYIISVTVF